MALAASGGGSVCQLRGARGLGMLVALLAALLLAAVAHPASAAVAKRQAVDLALAKADSPDPVRVGDGLTYTLTVSNRLSTQAAAVRLTDVLPAQVSFRSVSADQGSCAESRGSVTCRLGKLAGSASASVRIEVVAKAAGIVRNSATVRSEGTEATPPDKDRKSVV